MRRTLLSIAVALAMSTTAAVAAKPACPAMSGEPAGAFREGVVDGQWVGVVLNEVGGGGGALSVIVFTTDQYGALSQLGPVRVFGPRGDNMDATFVRGKLYLVNAAYENSDPAGRASHLAVQRFGIHRGAPPTVALAREGVAIVENPRAERTVAQRSCGSIATPYAPQKLREEVSAATYR